MESGQEVSNEFILIAGTSGMLLLAFTVILFIYLYQRKIIRKNQAYQEIEKKLQQQELNSAYALLEGQDQERKRIAEELHDNLGSILVSLNMYIDTIINSNDRSKNKQLLERVKEIAVKASDETRGLSHQLSSVSLTHFGLNTALNDLLEIVSESKEIIVSSTFLFNGALSNELSLNIYRIVQELVNNTLKHSQARHISLEVSKVGEEYISIIYHDNGSGFDVENAKKGLGLTNIRSRVDRFEGELHIESNEQGSTFVIELLIK